MNVQETIARYVTQLVELFNKIDKSRGYTGKITKSDILDRLDDLVRSVDEEIYYESLIK